MPTPVIWFEILSYLVLFLQLVVGALIYPEVSQQLGEGLIYALSATWVLVSVFLIWSAARRRKNWVRWLFLVGLGVDVFFAVPTMADDFKSNIVIGAIKAIILLLNGAATYLLFSPAAQPWFAKRPKTANNNWIAFSHLRIFLGMVALAAVSSIPFILSPWWGMPTMETFPKFVVIIAGSVAWAIMGGWTVDKSSSPTNDEGSKP